MDKKIRVNKTEFINAIKKHLADKDEKYLYNLCFSYGYKSVIYEATKNKMSPSIFDFLSFESDEKIELIKSKCNSKRFSSMALYSIWIVYYSGLLMQLDCFEKLDNNSIRKMFELGETFFNIKNTPIIFWPFEGSNPFINRMEADKFQVSKMPRLLDGEFHK